MLISWITKWRARKSWSCNTELRGEINNDELALISGGWTRVAHLMVLRLLDNECVGLKKSLTGKLSLIYRKECERNLSTDLPLLKETKARSNKGMDIRDISGWLELNEQSREEYLAIRGLRAMSSEQKAITSKLRLFAWAYLIIGIVLMFYMEFLFLLPIIAIIGVWVLYMFSWTNPVTSRGTEILNENKVKLSGSIENSTDYSYAAFAMCGWLGIRGTAYVDHLDKDVANYFEHSDISPKTGSGSEGTGGCGTVDSGCGGCGGCGG